MDIEHAVWGDIEVFLRNPGAVLEEMARRQTAGRSAAAFNACRLKSSRAALAAKDGERDKVLGLYRRGRITEMVLDAQLDSIEAERATLAAEVAAAEDTGRARAETEGRLQGAAGLLAELGRRLDAGLTFETRRKIVEALVENVEVRTSRADGRGEVSVAVTYCFAVRGTRIAAQTPSRARGNQRNPGSLELHRQHCLARRAS